MVEIFAGLSILEGLAIVYLLYKDKINNYFKSETVKSEATIKQSFTDEFGRLIKK
jgi:hypothetical protein